MSSKRIVEELQQLMHDMENDRDLIRDAAAHVQEMETSRGEMQDTIQKLGETLRETRDVCDAQKDLVKKLREECDAQRDLIVQLQTQIAVAKFKPSCFWCR